jgi:hypothetical protein
MRSGKETEISLGKWKWNTGNVTMQTALLISRRIPLQEGNGAKQI